jgi:glyoxylase-like metal-dependent hydrolase (beta-lactamase superfamily II)
LVVIYVPLDQPTGDLVHRFRPADPSGAGRWLDIVPDRLVRAPEKLTVGGVEFELYPITGEETSDGLVIHLPDRGVALVGDMLMPQLGGPFFPEGSVEGLFESMTLVEGLAPRVVIHGHTPLTDLFTIDLFPVLAAALQDLHQTTLEAIRSTSARLSPARTASISRSSTWHSPRRPGSCAARPCRREGHRLTRGLAPAARPS